ncbi:MAG: histone deacetylase family protein [Wenzhouxiangellaceae bacterium]
MLRIYHHTDYAAHANPDGHPESTARWTAIGNAWQGLEDHFELRQPPLASTEQITLLHPADYWQALCEREPGPDQPPLSLDDDTWLSHGSIAAAARGAGAVLAGVDDVWPQGGSVFCAARPPGHHAGLAMPMGFCLINPIALGAAHARKTLGAERVAIVDFDVHHGNGTQDIFARDPSVMFASSHQQPLYPGTGNIDETGAGNLINRPLPAGSGSETFRATWAEDILPRIADFKPELLLVSAGFDAHRDDPLAQINLEDDDYRWIGEQLKQFADDHCHGRLVAMVEGGYNLEALQRSVRGFLLGINSS